MKPERPRLLRVQTVAREYLDCSTRHVWTLLAQGLLESVKLGPRSTRITEASVLRFIKSRTSEA